MITENNIVKIERVFNANAQTIWEALTQPEIMKQWYFDIPSFRAELGFKFQFSGGTPEKTYVHLCEVTEVIPESKLTYSWRYEGYEGISFVTFELQPDGEQTLLTLTHTGIDTFPSVITDFAIHNFDNGWNHIINISLQDFLK